MRQSAEAAGSRLLAGVSTGGRICLSFGRLPLGSDLPRRSLAHLGIEVEWPPEPVPFSASEGRPSGHQCFHFCCGHRVISKVLFRSGPYLLSSWQGRNCLWEAGLRARPQSNCRSSGNSCGVIQFLGRPCLVWSSGVLCAFALSYVNVLAMENSNLTPKCTFLGHILHSWIKRALFIWFKEIICLYKLRNTTNGAMEGSCLSCPRQPCSRLSSLLCIWESPFSKCSFIVPQVAAFTNHIWASSPQSSPCCHPRREPSGATAPAWKSWWGAGRAPQPCISLNKSKVPLLWATVPHWGAKASELMVSTGGELGPKRGSLT